MRGAGEIGARAPDERSGDHPADIERVAQTPSDLAQVVKALQPERLLMSGDLQNGIGGSVKDRRQRAQMFLSIVLDHSRPGGVLVAKNARQLALSDQRA